MTARYLLGAAAGALSFAAPALAQDADYEYARPAPPPEETVIFESEPVVQPVPGETVAPAAPASETRTYEYEAAPLPPPPPPPVEALPPPPPPVVLRAPMPAGPAPGYATAPYGYPPQAGYSYPYPYPPRAAAYAPPPFDREAWLDDCRLRIRGTDERERGGIIGGLLGAIGGGIVGNRVADGERLAGTLIGAGVGGLAGLAIGTAIGAVAGRDRVDECELYLDRYLSAYPGPGYGYGYGYPAYAITYVPVMVAVPQRAVVHEYVTTEWVDAPATATRTVVETKVVRRPAPAKPAKIVK